MTSEEELICPVPTNIQNSYVHAIGKFTYNRDEFGRTKHEDDNDETMFSMPMGC